MPPPVNGQSLCFNIIAMALSNKVVVDRNVDQFGPFKKILTFLIAYYQSLVHLFFGRIHVVYISVSRSWPGTLFDSSLILLSKFLGKRVVLHLHGNDFLKSKAKRTGFAWIYSLADCFIALSEPMKRYLESVLSCSVEVVLNPIQDLFLNTHKPKPEDGIIRMVYLSNIMFSKGIFDYLSVAELTQNQHSESAFEFHVIGKFLGDHELSGPQIEKQFKSTLSTLKNTTFHGSLYGNELVNTLNRMDVLIFPSFYPVEALPLSVLEAASQSMYIVVNDHNDLSVFTNLLPQVHVMDTRNHQAILGHLLSMSKEEIRSLGQQNRMQSKEYSAGQHIQRVKELLSANA